LAGRRLAYVGDGGNVAHSLLEAAALAGMDVRVAIPYGLEPHPEVVARARALAAEHGSRVELTLDPSEAVRGADAVVTDVWLSLQDPGRARAARTHVLRRFRVDARLLSAAKPEVVFLHCLPAHRGEEVTGQVLDGSRSLVFEQAANLLPVAQAVLATLLQGKLGGHPGQAARPRPDRPPGRRHQGWARAPGQGASPGRQRRRRELEVHPGQGDKRADDDQRVVQDRAAATDRHPGRLALEHLRHRCHLLPCAAFSLRAAAVVA
jgi:hypothetical protein